MIAVPHSRAHLRPAPRGMTPDELTSVTTKPDGTQGEGLMLCQNPWDLASARARITTPGKISTKGRAFISHRLRSEGDSGYCL